jgi:hypothetical protein
MHGHWRDYRGQPLQNRYKVGPKGKAPPYRILTRFCGDTPGPHVPSHAVTLIPKEKSPDEVQVISSGPIVRMNGSF